jgi:hypothetical protein
MGDVAMTVPVYGLCRTTSRGENYRGVEAVLSLFLIPFLGFFLLLMKRKAQNFWTIAVISRFKTAPHRCTLA